MRPTRKDVSRLSGVSVSTVGMILSGRGEHYRDDTRRKVTEAARQINYLPSISARGLRTRQSFLIGLSVFQSNAVWMSRILRGIQHGLEASEFSALAFSHASQQEELDCHRRCADREVAGMIINPGLAIDGSFKTKMSYLDLIGKNVPTVEILGHAVAEAPSINMDDVSSGRMATEHLLALGHRRIAMLTHDRYNLASHARSGLHADAWRRFEGYRDAMLQAGLSPIAITHPIHGEVAVDDDFFKGGAAALNDLLNHPSRPTAVVCYNDLEAYGLMRAAEKRNMKVPRELSIVGHGDYELARMVEPGITTFAIPAFELGRRAAECLLRLINKESFEDSLLESTLMIRGSTCAVN